MQLQLTKAYRHVNVLSSGDIVCENLKDEKQLLLRAGRKLTDRLIYLLKRHHIRYVYVEQPLSQHHYDVETRTFLTRFFKMVYVNNERNRYAHLFLNKEYSCVIQTLLAAYLQDNRLREEMHHLMHDQMFSQAVEQFSLATLLAKRMGMERLGDTAIAYFLIPCEALDDTYLKGYFERIGLAHLSHILKYKCIEQATLDVQILQVVSTYVTMTRENPMISLQEIYHLMHEQNRWSNELLYHFRELLEEGARKKEVLFTQSAQMSKATTQALPMRTTITLCKMGQPDYERLLCVLQYVVEEKYEQATMYVQELLAKATPADWLTTIVMPLKQLIEAGAYELTVERFIDDLLLALLKELRSHGEQKKVALLIINEKMKNPQLLALLEGILLTQKLMVYRPPFIKSAVQIERLKNHYEAQHIIVVGHAPKLVSNPAHYYELQESQLASLLYSLAGERIRDYAFMKKLTVYDVLQTESK